MKIGFVLDDGLDTPDGVQQYVLTLGSWLKDHGHEVHYLVGETKRSDLDNLHSLAKNLKVRFNRNRLSIPVKSSRKKISQLLDAEKFDVLHVQMPFSPLLAGKIIDLAPTDTALVGTFHILPYSKTESRAAKLLSHFTKSQWQKLSAIICVSDAAQKFTQDKLKMPSFVLPNAVDIQRFKMTKPVLDSIIEQRIVYLGRLVERKGCLYLLKALNYIKQNKLVNNPRLYICGDGPLRSKLERYSLDNGLTKQVVFVGRLDENAKAGYLASGDLAVFPSLGGESFGIVLIEAMATGKTVVLGGDNPGYASVLNQQSEYLFDPKNTALFAQKLAQYLSDKDLRKKSIADQQILVKNYDINVVGPKIIVTYQRAIAKK